MEMLTDADISDDNLLEDHSTSISSSPLFSHENAEDTQQLYPLALEMVFATWNDLDK
jgi:hypothetical protein